MGHINYETKTDRELLIIVAETCNETTNHLARLNDTIAKHEKRITMLEAGGCNHSWKDTLKVNWQTLTLLSSVLALIILELGQKLLWW